MHRFSFCIILCQYVFDYIFKVGQMNDDNLDRIVKYLEKVKKENRKKNLDDVNVPGLKRVSASDSYRITPLGRHYLTMIG